MVCWSEYVKALMMGALQVIRNTVIRLSVVAVMMFGVAENMMLPALAAGSAYDDGVVMYKAHKYVEAEKSLRKSVAEDHASDPLAHFYLAETLMFLGKPAEAAEEYDAAVNKNAPSSILRYCREQSKWLRSVVYEQSGIGVKIDRHGFVLDVAAGSPAAKAGLVKGDRISTVDGVPKVNITNIFSAIRGKAGTAVTVVVVRGNQSIGPLNIVRENLKPFEDAQKAKDASLTK